MRNTISLFILMITSLSLPAQEKISFPSRDGLPVTADWYKTDERAPVIILFHQAGFSRGEYSETAKKLNTYGFSCLAVDLRSGAEANGVKNETAAKAKEQNKPADYLASEQDMIAAIDYVFQLRKKKVIIFGSSYSASLALKLMKDNRKIAAVIAFSPGEYFDTMSIRKLISGNTDKPVFVTSSKEEAPAVSVLIENLHSLSKVQFVPQRDGTHGSKALWQSNPNNREYWMNLKLFLDTLQGLQ